MRHFSNTFDMYQFLIRYEYTKYELTKSLLVDLPFQNRMSRSYNLNSQSMVQEMVSRKARKRTPVPVTVGLKNKLRMYHCLKQLTVRQKHNQRSIGDANQMLAEMNTIPSAAQFQTVQRKEIVNILSSVIGEKESSQGAYKIYQRGKEMTCQIILNTPLYAPDLKFEQQNCSMRFQQECLYAMSIARVTIIRL
jgi:protease II